MIVIADVRALDLSPYVGQSPDQKTDKEREEAEMVNIERVKHIESVNWPVTKCPVRISLRNFNSLNVGLSRVRDAMILTADIRALDIGPYVKRLLDEGTDEERQEAEMVNLERVKHIESVLRFFQERKKAIAIEHVKLMDVQQMLNDEENAMLAAHIKAKTDREARNSCRNCGKAGHKWNNCRWTGGPSNE